MLVDRRGVVGWVGPFRTGVRLVVIVGLTTRMFISLFHAVSRLPVVKSLSRTHRS